MSYGVINNPTVSRAIRKRRRRFQSAHRSLLQFHTIRNNFRPGLRSFHRPRGSAESGDCNH